jgi:tetratricopeptide (TPR) repeat protein
MADVTRALPAALERAVAACERGQLGEADRLARTIVSTDPHYFDALFLIAAIDARQSRLGEALAGYDRALAVQPDHANALNDRGVTLHLLQRFEEALASYDRALAVQPDHADALNNRGLALHQLQRWDEALASYIKALTLRPHYAAALYNCGVTSQQLRRFGEALASYDRALALQPDYVDALSNRGVTLYELQQFDAALASYDRALALRPDHAEALNNRGVTLQQLRRFEEALASYDRALAVRADYADALNNRGVALNQLQRFEEALASHDQALAVRPDYADALSNRGNTLLQLKRFDAALASYDRALALRPDYAEAHFNKSLLQLLQGDFDAGWRAYEWRWSNENLKLARRDFAQPLWLGEAVTAGKTVLLHSEQGFGDTIQFCRFAPLVAARGLRVLLEVPAPLKDLMASLAGVAEVISANDRLPHFDWHCPLHSLPLALGTPIETIPAHVPYLSAPQESLRRWSAALGPSHRLRVGVAWSGTAMHRNDANRSIKLRALLPLLDVDAGFVSLQRDVRTDDARVLHDCGDLVHFADALESFADTAAVIASLDLVISVDTSVAHLAGALAKPVWILLPFVPDFRWLLDREDSPWYPTARLFRQDSPGDWPGVIGRVVIELERLLHAHDERASA